MVKKRNINLKSKKAKVFEVIVAVKALFAEKYTATNAVDTLCKTFVNDCVITDSVADEDRADFETACKIDPPIPPACGDDDDDKERR
jgi:hypothetical protein